MDRWRKGGMHSRQASEDVVQASALRGARGGLRAAGVKLNPKNSCVLRGETDALSWLGASSPQQRPLAELRPQRWGGLAFDPQHPNARP